MISLAQAEFTRLARGSAITPGEGPDVEWFLLGIRSSAGAAIRWVHKESAARGRSHFAGVNAQYLFGGGPAAAAARNYRDCIERYIALDGAGGPAVAMPTKGVSISFPPGNVVRARPDVVIGPDASGLYEARVLLWDELPLSRQAAEMIALPALKYVRSKLGAEAGVVVWQLAREEEEIVSAGEADARQADVEGLLAAADAGS
jgi:hypothetical protein